MAWILRSAKCGLHIEVCKVWPAYCGLNNVVDIMLPTCLWSACFGQPIVICIVWSAYCDLHNVAGILLPAYCGLHSVVGILWSPYCDVHIVACIFACLIFVHFSDHGYTKYYIDHNA